MDACALLFGEKGHICCEKILSLQRRFPSLLPKNALKEFSAFLSQLSDNFLESRSQFLLLRIFFSLYRANRQITEQEAQRVYLKVLPITTSTFGIAIAVVRLRDSERFNEKHILRGIQNLVPAVAPVASSYCFYTFRSAFLYYLEIKKTRGLGFSKSEKQKLRTDLIPELSNAIESISQSFFLHGNDEELFKNIRHLGQELKYVHDLPQVMISFVEYVHDTLKFLVTVLRVLLPTTPSFDSLSTQLPSLVQFSLEKVICVGSLRKKYPKEAVVFTLEIQSTPFSRNHQTVNLRSARLYIVKAIESMLGPFRDYNGGLFNKENEQLHDIKRALHAKNIGSAFLEDFFYSVKPIEMRSQLQIDTSIEIATLLQKMSDIQVDKARKYTLCFSKHEDLHVAIIKTQEKNWKTTLSSRILSYSHQFGCSVLEREGSIYFCFFHQYAETYSEDLFQAINQELAEHLIYPYSKKTVMNINFQSGDPASLNPRLAADMPCHILANLLFEGLTRINRSGVCQPAAAEKIEVSKEGTIYTFHLHQAWWSNGEEVTASHFETAWKKALMISHLGFPYPDFFFHIKNVQKAREKIVALEDVGIEVLNAKTLRVTLESPCSYFLDLVSTPPFFPMLGLAEEPSHFNGPFTVAEWIRGSHLNLSQNPFYRDAQHIKLGGIKIYLIRNPYVAFDMFQNGKLDFLGDPISPLPPEIVKKESIKERLIHKKISRIYWIHCNLRTPPLNNALLRRALSLAINRKKITENVFIHQFPQISPLPAKYAHFNGLEEGDPVAAVKYFEKALKSLGQVRKNFPPIVLTHSDLSFEKPLFEELKKQWQEVLGIRVVDHHLRWNEFSAAIEKGNFQLCGLFRRDFFNNALFYLSFFKSTPNNPFSLENQEFAALLAQLEKGHRSAALKKIENLLIKETPVIPLVNQKFLALVAKHVQGLDWDENGCLDFKQVWLSDES